jgi:hypothetical protein
MFLFFYKFCLLLCEAEGDKHKTRIISTILIALCRILKTLIHFLEYTSEFKHTGVSLSMYGVSEDRLQMKKKFLQSIRNLVL